MRSLIKVIGSGSSGNSLAIYDSKGDFILVDVGLPIKTILKGIDYDLGHCRCALVSHVHRDHSRSISELAKMGIPVYANEHTCATFSDAIPFKSALVGVFGGFRVQTFGVDHNAPNNAFIIDSVDGIRILYITDARYVPCAVRNVNYAIVECNYSDEDIMYNEMAGEAIQSRYDNHLSLSQCIDYIQAIKSESLRAVLLWHLSKSNISPQYALNKAKEEIGMTDVYLPASNSQINLISMS